MAGVAPPLPSFITATAGVVQWATDGFWHPCRRILIVKAPTPNTWYGSTLLPDLISYMPLPAVCGLQPEHSCVLWPRHVPSILQVFLPQEPPSLHIHQQPSLWELHISSGRGCALCSGFPTSSTQPGIEYRLNKYLFCSESSKIDRKRNLVKERITVSPVDAKISVLLSYQTTPAPSTHSLHPLMSSYRFLPPFKATLSRFQKPDHEYISSSPWGPLETS